MTKKRRQIENRIHSLTQGQAYLDQAYDRGRKVWIARCAEHALGIHVYTLTSGACCMDWWPTLDAAHDALFRDAGIRADNY